jgi:SP family general alpha glucoside:H+ symporter-like MFS transporter
MTGFTEPKRDATLAADDGALEKSLSHQAEIFEDKELMTDAQAAENREHDMGMWEAVKDHPMACFWAFIFCFTIVSLSALLASLSGRC